MEAGGDHLHGLFLDIFPLDVFWEPLNAPRVLEILMHLPEEGILQVRGPTKSDTRFITVKGVLKLSD
eukprot:9503423-Pyramimonas_sp.AAC.1